MLIEGRPVTIATRRFANPGPNSGLDSERICGACDEIAQAYGVHPVMVGRWKKEIIERVSALFEAKRGPKPVDQTSSEDWLYGEIGRWKMEVDWLEKFELWRRDWAGSRATPR